MWLRQYRHAAAKGHAAAIRSTSPDMTTMYIRYRRKGAAGISQSQSVMARLFYHGGQAND